MHRGQWHKDRLSHDGSFLRRIRNKDTSSHSLSSAYRSRGNFSINKSHQILHISDWGTWTTKTKDVFTHTFANFTWLIIIWYRWNKLNLSSVNLEQLVGNFHTLAIDMEICISLNWLKSWSKFIQVCQSLSCFWLTAFTTICFQCGFSGKSAFLV
jgi:hypothetical protein